MADRREIVHALLGPTPEHTHLYHTSPSFHAAIDALATMLPPMVNGLAIEAARQDKQIMERIVRINQGTDPWVPVEVVASFPKEESEDE